MHLRSLCHHYLTSRLVLETTPFSACQTTAEHLQHATCMVCTLVCVLLFNQSLLTLTLSYNYKQTNLNQTAIPKRNLQISHDFRAYTNVNLFLPNKEKQVFLEETLIGNEAHEI